MCGVSRFCASNTVIRNSTFHHSTANLGRLKGSDSVIEGNTWFRVTGVIELLGLEGWLEGPMLLNNITVVSSLGTQSLNVTSRSLSLDPFG